MDKKLKMAIGISQLIFSVSLFALCSGVDTVKEIISLCQLHSTNLCPPCSRKGIEATFEMSMEMYRLLDINDVTESFEFTGLFTYAWTDQCIFDLYNNESIRPEVKSDQGFDKTDEIWAPDVIHLNSMTNQKLKGDDFESRMFILPQVGVFQYYLYGNFKSYCDLDFFKFPFDSQTCHFDLLLGVQTIVNITIKHFGVSIGENAIPTNSMWEAIDFRHHLKGDSSHRLIFQCKRNPAYFVNNLIIPSVVLSVLELATFFIPSDSGGDRPSYAGTILLSMFLIQSQALSYVPKTPKPVTVGNYILLVIGHATGCTLYAAFSVWFTQNYSEASQKKISILSYKPSIRKLADTIALFIAILALVVLYTTAFVLLVT